MDTRVIRLQFETEKLLSAKEPMAVALTRLMTATNDVILLQKLVLLTQARSEGANEFEKDILNGELGYFVRMLCGHLYEAGIAFRNLEATSRDRIDKIIGADVEARTAFKLLRKVFGDDSEDGFYKVVLGPIRNLAGFHYKEKTVLEGLEALRTRGEFIISEHIGFTRYVLTDEIMTKKAWEVLGGKSKYAESVRVAFELADELAIAVTHLLKDLLDNQKVESRETIGTLPIPEEISRIRAKIKESRGQKSEN